MNTDLMYSLLMNCSWFFLGGWAILLLAASAAAFREDFEVQMNDRNSTI